MDLVLQQKNIHQEAAEVIEKLSLINTLKEYGVPHFVGSFELGLMTWRDIDIEVVVKDISHPDLSKIVASLINHNLRRIDFAVTDNRGIEKTPRTPEGFYLDIKYFGDDIKPEERFGNNEKVWKIDIHFVKENDSNAIKQTKSIKDKLTPKFVNIILDIKNQIWRNPKYKKQIFSIDIYNAVLENSVHNLNEFEDYLKQIGKSL